MIRLIAAYYPVDNTGRKLEAASAAKIRTMLEEYSHLRMVFQDSHGNIYNHTQLKGQAVELKDRSIIRID